MQSLRQLATAVCAALLLSAASTAETQRDHPSHFLTVSTTNGPITGHWAPGSCPKVVEYLGIPYAKPPVGALRFAAPQRFVSDTEYEAAAFGNDCPLSPSPPVDYPGLTAQAPRIIASFASGLGSRQGEDCLTLNIWSQPTGRSVRHGKPVLVFFYGGRFTIGNTNSPFYNGKYFAAAQDVIVVTVNYRINIFGFPGGPDEETQNLGLRDQRTAVEWVRDNIRNFGGNPSKITIAGQSSGGASVDYWTYAYEKDPIVNGIIASSGNAFSFPVNAKNVTEKNWATVVHAVGCNSAANVMACMREVDWEDIKDAAAAVKPGTSSSVLRSIPPFYPTPDNAIVFTDYVNRTRQGRFAKVPTFAGNNNNEAGYYRIPAYAKGIVPTEKQVEQFHLESFTCPVTYQAENRIEHNVPSWIWRYSGDWNNTRLYATSGAYHGSDLHMIFGASADVSGLPATTEQRKLTTVMQKAWFEFSNDPWHGLSDKVGWPQFNPRRKSLVVLGKDDSSMPIFVKPSEFDAPCSTISLGFIGE
ncbi:hypothetical protein JDV02_005589 [Purpureocillium takamizusanense]|uniref:Carboxylic ester hydrolase n=1 Tax=Purpureocillium takamizusanense TaxID=2060973 RepID=A0A9Q8QGU9_9HYPO|nr:uncharacterized protein JDV02_005589 [Purpureocillium takamizusanense]UNI19405.1 hypothetical protein JDV02_005589 [Purpureocillium takamizusanense]